MDPSTHSSAGKRHRSSAKAQPLPAKRPVVKEEQMDLSDDDNDQMLCVKHHKPLECIHCPRTAASPPKYKRDQIKLTNGKYIIRGDPSFMYVDEFTDHCIWGNEVLLYKKHVLNLRKLISNEKNPNIYYVCHMTKTFSTCEQRMYFKTHFSEQSLFPHMDGDQMELPIKSGDNTTRLTAHFIKRGSQKSYNHYKLERILFQSKDEGRKCVRLRIQMLI